MSGDVQPRKRKDKRRKKEGDTFGASQDLSSFHKSKNHGERKTSDFIEQGEKIHVQNEQGIGGNICFKIVFFCLLFALLTGIAGIIYKLSQDTTDVEPPAFEESRFAEYFAGWVDDASNDHDHEGSENRHDDNNEHNEGEEEEEETHDSTQEDEGTHESHEDQQSEPDLLSSLFSFGGNEEADKSEEGVDQSSPVEESREVTQEVEDDDDDDDGDSDEENISENGNNDSEETGSNKEKEGNDEDDDFHDTKPITSIKEKIRRFKFLYNRKFNREGRGPDNHDSAKSRMENIRKKFKFDFDDEDQEDGHNDVENSEENYDASQVDEEEEEQDKHEASKTIMRESIDSEHEDEKQKPNGRLKPLESSKEPIKKDQEKQAPLDDLGYDEIDDSYDNDDDSLGSVEEAQEEIVKEDTEESLPPTAAGKDYQTSQEPHENKENHRGGRPDEEERGGVVVKLGVGIALIIVAHLVLVQKWKAKGNVTPDEIVSNSDNDVETLNSEPEPVISRRQTLVPENIEFDDGEDMVDDEECSEYEGEGNGDYFEGDEEAEEEDYDEDYLGEEEEEESEFIDKVEPVSERRFGDNHSKLNYERQFCLKRDEYMAPLESPEDEDFEQLDSEEVDEEYNYEDDEYAEEEEYEQESYGEEEEEADQQFQIQSNLPVVLRKKSVNLEEDVTPVPPPRIHKKGGQSAEEEWENRSEEVPQQENDPHATDNQEDSPPQSEPLSNSAEKKVGDEEDWTFGQEFQYAEEQFENNPKEAHRICEDILKKKPDALKPLILRARALDQMAERERSNTYLKQAVHAYKTLLLQEGHRLSDDTYDQLADRCISRMRFGGHHAAAIDVHKGLIVRFPNDPKHRNDLAVTYLMLNRIEPARWVLNETLTRWPTNGFALVHYGFIVKTADNNMEEGARLLMNGIKTKEKGVKDGMFFFHLGDALTRLGRPEEALKWYDRGVEEGLFLSRYQRSLYNVNRLKGRPWWTKEQTTYKSFFDLLEKNWKEIRREGLALLNSKQGNPFREESENLKDTGDWRQLDLYFRGRKQANCDKAPITCSLVSSFRPASTCTRGQIKFSVMLPKTHVWPHCGPTNCRLRSHLGLVVPPKTYIRVAEETRSWEEGKVMIFDDSFEHEVWHNGTGLRLVLIVDVWHPEITEQERRTLSPI